MTAQATQYIATFAFQPMDATGVSVTAGTSAAASEIAPAPKQYNNAKLRQVRVINSDTTIAAYIRFGGSTVAANTTDSILIPANDIEVFTLPAGVTHVSYITASGTAALNFCIGEGV